MKQNRESLISNIKTPLVVGYKGEIGSFILQSLLKVMSKASNIYCFDINELEEERIKRIEISDYIFLCIPIKETVNWLIKYKSYLKNKIIVEQASLKEWIYKDKRIKDLKLIPMHILFRPSATPSKKDRLILIIDNGVLNNEGIASELHKFQYDIEDMTNSKVEIIHSIKDHDMLMAIKQALIHKIIAALGKTVLFLSSDKDTYMSRQIKELYFRMKDGNEDLYKFIQTNKYSSEAMSYFKKELNRKNLF